MILQFQSWAQTDAGALRKTNEDAFLNRAPDGLWAVADGMGGHRYGDRASTAIIDGLQSTKLRPELSLAEAVDRVDDTLESVNKELRRLGKSYGGTIGSTVALLLVRDGYAVCGWVGDSRVYRSRIDPAGESDLRQLSHDHALVTELVDHGVIDREQASNHPQSNLVTRALGASDNLFLDLEIVALEPGDRFLLCTDGLDKSVDEATIGELLSLDQDANNPDRTNEPVVDNDPSSRLVRAALEAKCDDNVTALVVQVEQKKQTDEH